MRFLKKFFKEKTRENASDEPVLVAAISDDMTSELFRGMLENNGIKFLCRQYGIAKQYACDTPASIMYPHYIYVMPENSETACGLYNAFFSFFSDLKEN